MDAETLTELLQNAFLYLADKKYPENSSKTMYTNESTDTGGERESSLLQEEKWRWGSFVYALYLATLQRPLTYMYIIL